MTRPSWVSVLTGMFQDEEHLRYVANIDENHPLSQSTGLNPEDINQAINILVDKNWIEYKRDDGTEKFYLTSEGFEIALDRSLREQQTEINNRSLWVSILMTVAVGLQALSTITVPQPYVELYNLSIGLLVLTVFAGLLFGVLGVNLLPSRLEASTDL